MFEKAKNEIEFKNPLDQNKTDSESNICPSIDYESYKIQNKTEFCRDAQKKEVIPLEQGGQDYEYLMIKDNEQVKCGKIVDLYNLCIDTDYLLYPYSDYKRCFNKANDIYSCNIIRKNKNSYEKEMVYFKIF